MAASSSLYSELTFYGRPTLRRRRKTKFPIIKVSTHFSFLSTSAYVALTRTLSLIDSGVDVTYEVPERSEKIISPGTPLRLVYRGCDGHKKIKLFTPLKACTHTSTSIHIRLTSSAPCGRSYALDIKYTSLSENN